MPKDRIIDGVDQTDLLLGKNTKGGRNTFSYEAHIDRWENIFTVNGVRFGKWKFLKAEHTVPGYATDRDCREVIELYDLEADIGENNNLADQHPEVVRRMEAELETFWDTKD